MNWTKTIIIILFIWQFAGDVLSWKFRGKTTWEADNNPFEGNGISLPLLPLVVDVNNFFGINLKKRGDRHDHRYRNYQYYPLPLAIIARFWADLCLGCGVAWDGLYCFLSSKRILNAIKCAGCVGYGLFLFLGTRIGSMFHFHQRKGKPAFALEVILLKRLREFPV